MFLHPCPGDEYDPNKITEINAHFRICKEEHRYQPWLTPNCTLISPRAKWPHSTIVDAIQDATEMLGLNGIRRCFVVHYSTRTVRFATI